MSELEVAVLRHRRNELTVEQFMEAYRLTPMPSEPPVYTQVSYSQATCANVAFADYGYEPQEPDEYESPIGQGWTRGYNWAWYGGSQ